MAKNQVKPNSNVPTGANVAGTEALDERNKAIILELAKLLETRFNLERENTKTYKQKQDNEKKIEELNRQIGQLSIQASDGFYSRSLPKTTQVILSQFDKLLTERNQIKAAKVKVEANLAEANKELDSYQAREKREEGLLRSLEDARKQTGAVTDSYVKLVEMITDDPHVRARAKTGKLGPDDVKRLKRILKEEPDEKLAKLTKEYQENFDKELSAKNKEINKLHKEIEATTQRNKDHAVVIADLIEERSGLEAEKQVLELHIKYLNDQNSDLMRDLQTADEEIRKFKGSSRLSPEDWDKLTKAIEKVIEKRSAEHTQLQESVDRIQRGLGGMQTAQDESFAALDERIQEQGRRIDEMQAALQRNANDQNRMLSDIAQGQGRRIDEIQAALQRNANDQNRMLSDISKELRAMGGKIDTLNTRVAAGAGATTSRRKKILKYAGVAAIALAAAATVTLLSLQSAGVLPAKTSVGGGDVQPPTDGGNQDGGNQNEQDNQFTIQDGNFDFTADQTAAFTQALVENGVISSKVKITGLQEVAVEKPAAANSAAEGQSENTTGRTIFYFQTEENGVNGILEVPVDQDYIILEAMANSSMTSGQDFAESLVMTAIGHMNEDSQTRRYVQLSYYNDAYDKTVETIVDKVQDTLKLDNEIEAEKCFFEINNKNYVNQDGPYSKGEVNVAVFTDSTIYKADGIVSYQSKGSKVSSGQVLLIWGTNLGGDFVPGLSNNCAFTDPASVSTIELEAQGVAALKEVATEAANGQELQDPETEEASEQNNSVVKDDGMTL